MEKEKVTKFDINTAFQALDEIEYPKVGGVKPQRFREQAVRQFNTGEALVEDFYNVNDPAELEDASEERDKEIAQAKLAKIEKIVDLDAESADELLGSYEGKVIIQCPQCKTMFYKDQEDIEVSEEDPSIVNVFEVCQHCGNDEGYELVGKVAAVEPEEMQPAEEELPMEEPIEGEELPEEEPTEEELPAAEGEEELELEPVETEEEKKEESFNTGSGQVLTEEAKEIVDIYDGTGSHIEREEGKQYISRDDELVEIARANPEKEYHYHTNDDDFEVNIKDIPSNIKLIKESLTEEVDPELNKRLEEHNEYIKHLQEKIDQAEKELEAEKNEEIKASIQKIIDEYKAELEAALPEAVKSEPIEEEPIEEVEEPVEEVPELEKAESEEVKESLTEDFKPEECEGEECEKNPDADLIIDKTEKVEEAKECVRKDANGNVKESIESELREFERGLEENCDESLEEAKEQEDQFDLTDKEWDEWLDIFGKEPVHEDICPVCGDEVDEPCEDCKKELEEEADNCGHNPAVKEMEQKVLDSMEEAACVNCEEAKFEDIEDLDECSMNKAITEYLQAVYENVDKFEATGCEMKDKKLVVEGMIKFNSGSSRSTLFEFKQNKTKGNVIIFHGLNESFSKKPAFILRALVEDKKLITEKLKYKYEINGTLVEGLIK